MKIIAYLCFKSQSGFNLILETVYTGWVCIICLLLPENWKMDHDYLYIVDLVCAYVADISSLTRNELATGI